MLEIIFPCRITLISRIDPIRDGPPQAYRALNAVASEGRVYVPGRCASPVMVTRMLRIFPSVIFTFV
jgi:hypothetical protein